MPDLVLQKVNSTYVRITCDQGIAQELSEYFQFEIPGARFMAKYQYSNWDGKIRLFNKKTGQIYYGLIDKIIQFAEDREYSIELPKEHSDVEFSEADALGFISTLGLPFDPRDYQVWAFITAVRKKRLLILSPTSSGKSLIIYLILRYYGAKSLIIVPTIALTSQMASDFADYGYTKAVHKITGGVEKNSQTDITTTTWQSVSKLQPDYFNQYDVIIVDEVHGAKATSLTGIMEKCIQCDYRIGLTGTLNDTQVHKLQLEGLFGPVHKTISTSEMMAKGYSAKLKIRAILLNYPDHIKKQIKGSTYQDEMKFIIGCESRNRFIKDLVVALKGNTFVMFQLVEKHGKLLYEQIKEAAGSTRNVYFVAGETDADERESVRKILETETDAICIVSKVFSTGTNVKNLSNIVLVHPSKARINLLQSIGRSLRLYTSKEFATLYDIGDDLSWKSKINHTLGHFKQRIKIYAEEKFAFKISNVNIKYESNSTS